MPDSVSRRSFLQYGVAAAAGPFLVESRPAPRPPRPPLPKPLQTPFDLEESTIAQLQDAMRSGARTSRSICAAYLARIAALDPKLHAVLETNPDALAIADRLDGERKAGHLRGPLHGIPVLVKDNIATGDKMMTTAGSLALAGVTPPRDAPVVARLRAAGAVILGKTNLSEWANIRSSRSSSGWSARGGQCGNPYALDRNPCGSSSGTGAAISANFAAAGVGTETDGSIVCPSSACSLVGVKPTVGLIDGAGIIPIAHSQDTAGPLTRTVRDAAILLNVLAGPDPRDPATLPLKRPPDYTKFLDENGLKGARIGVPSDPSDPANDFYYRSISPRAHAAIGEVIATLEAQGATIVRANIPTEGWIGGPGTEMAILNRNPESRTKYEPARRSVVFVYELKHDLNTYLRDWLTGTQMHTMADIIAFNAAHAEKALRFGQDIFVAAEATRGDLSELEYKSARAMDLRASRALGLDIYMDKYRLDAVLFSVVAAYYVSVAVL